MHIQKFMKKYYRALSLTPDFYHHWDTCIHIELGNDYYQMNENNKLNIKKFQMIYRQVSEIIHLLFKQTDEIILVVNTYPKDREKTVYPHFFKRFVKNQRLKYSLHGHEFNWQFDEDVLFVQQMALCCKVSDLKLENLLKTCIHEDFYKLRPRLRKKHSIYAPDVFLVNLTTNCIFHLYDDRGCEIMNTNQLFHAELIDYFKGWETQSKISLEH